MTNEEMNFKITSSDRWTGRYEERRFSLQAAFGDDDLMTTHSGLTIGDIKNLAASCFQVIEYHRCRKSIEEMQDEDFFPY